MVRISFLWLIAKVFNGDKYLGFKVSVAIFFDGGVIATSKGSVYDFNFYTKPGCEEERIFLIVRMPYG
jgi:hypothetical protein